MIRTHHILLLRHGLTDANASGTIQGHAPTPLNPLGREQARRLAQRLTTYAPRPQVLISSDLPRAMQTAQPIADALSLPLQLDAAWRERFMGELEGKTLGDYEIWRTASGETELPGAESSAQFQARIHRALTQLPAQHPNVNTIAVVTHGGPCRTILRMLISGRLPLSPGQSPPDLVTIANCSIMHLICTTTADGAAWSIHCLNDTTHLADLLTTRDAG